MEHHTIIKVGNSRGDINVDLASSESIKKMFEKTGSFDALIPAAGNAKFGMLGNLSEDDYLIGINNKLIGQVKLYLLGRNYINDNGSKYCFRHSMQLFGGFCFQIVILQKVVTVTLWYITYVSSGGADPFYSPHPSQPAPPFIYPFLLSSLSVVSMRRPRLSL